jgi:hypothetical protein
MRRLTSHFLVLMIVLCLALPAGASGVVRDDGDVPNSVPLVLDVVLLRPLGLMATAVGAVFYAFPVAPIVAITRPGDLMKPFGPLVAAPGKFTFSDPLGQH